MTSSRDAASDLARLPGSSRPLAGGADSTTRLPPDEMVRATLVLRRRSGAEPDPGTRLSRAELADRFGASPDDVALVTDTLDRCGVRVLHADAASRRLQVEGRAEDIERA
ncbi:MAG TPA: protease pro-enzyme activation domain-containing protein, partial [Marmoricola sp.]